MDPKGRLSSEIHFLVPLGITYSDSLHCGNALSETNLLFNSDAFVPVKGLQHLCYCLDVVKF